MELITCKNLSVGHRGHAIQRNLNFSVHAGDYLCILGENGSGKSTLMKTMLQLLPALEGEVLLAGDMKPGQIGYLPQHAPGQRDFPASVKEIVLSGCLGRRGWRPFYSRQEKELAGQAMERMEIGELSGRCYRELSGGQKQRVLLARALCAAQRVLFLDEPVAGLDPERAEEMYRLIAELNEKDGITIIMISHDLQAAMLHATRILKLGEVVFFGSRQAYISDGGGKRHA